MMRFSTLLAAALLTFLLGAGYAGDEKPDASRLSVERIFDSEEFQSETFSSQWLPEGHCYTTLEKSADGPDGRDLVRYDAETGERQVLVSAALLVPPGQSNPLKIDDYAWSKDLALLLIYTNSKRVWRKNTRGDYWLLDRASRQLRKLGGDAPPASLMFAKIAPDGRHVAYVRDRNLYVESLRDHSIRCLTKRQTDTVINGTFDWVYEEELGLRDGFRWSPDGRSLAYWQIDTEGVPAYPLVNNTDSLYPQVTWLPYPKVGQTNPSCRVGVVEVDANAADPATMWIDVPGDARDHYIAWMEWTANSDELLIQQLNRLQNTNRVLLAHTGTANVETVFVDKDESWLDVHDGLSWIDHGTRFTWTSERDGWRHVYLVSRSGGDAKLVTRGDFDVIRLLHVDAAGGYCYFTASPDNPTQRFLYRVRLDGTGMERMTPEGLGGTHGYGISPDAKWAIHTFSSFDVPPTTDLVKLPSHQSVRKLARNKQLRKKVRRLRRKPTEFFRVDIGDGVVLDAYCMKPPEFDATQTQKYPLLIYVYGEPAAQTVLDRWGGNGYLWHLMLAQQGYFVMSIDNRGTPAPRGREWRKCVYRKIGVLAPQDQAAAVRAILKERSYLDAERIGVWGWSGGGSMTLNAIFKYPDLYRTAISVAPVPNMRYYDTIYQERYMGLPGDNVEGFTQGSPINFVPQLQGNLLVIHGTGDDNCHYATFEMLINELILHNKRFTMMAYPNRTHAIREGKNTTRHLRELMTEYLHENLPPGPRPQS